MVNKNVPEMGKSFSNPVIVHKENDNRPHNKINILGVEVVSLLDSGANSSIICKDGLDLIKSLGITIRTSKLKNVLTSKLKNVLTADGVKQPITGCVDIPIVINENCRVISFLIVPSLNYSFILGTDFCQKFQLKLYFKENTWEVLCDNKTNIALGGLNLISTVTFDNVSSLENLNRNQVVMVDKAIDTFKNLSLVGKIGKTNKIIYHIDTGEAQPFKQRQYLMSPYMLEHLNKELDKMLDLGVVENSQSG